MIFAHPQCGQNEVVSRLEREAPVDNSLLSSQEARGGVRSTEERRASRQFIIEGKYWVLRATNNDFMSRSFHLIVLFFEYVKATPPVLTSYHIYHVSVSLSMD